MFYSDRIMRLVIEHTLSLLPYEDVEVTTCGGKSYKGRRRVGEVRAVGMVPAATLPVVRYCALCLLHVMSAAHHVCCALCLLHVVCVCVYVFILRLVNMRACPKALALAIYVSSAHTLAAMRRFHHPRRTDNGSGSALRSWPHPHRQGADTDQPRDAQP